MPTPRDAEDWVLFRAQSDLGSWLRRSASAHTLVVGSAFALLLMVLSAQALRAYFPSALASGAAAVLLLAAVAAALPLPLLALRHEGRRVDAVSVDPEGLTLDGPRGTTRVPLAALREVRARAEPAFGARRPQDRGPLRDIPGFHAVLELGTTGGARHTFVSARSDDVAGLLAWLDVLGAGAAIVREPSTLAAQRDARDALGIATLALVAAVATVGLASLLQVAPRLGLLDASPTLLSLAGIGLGCALYATSYVYQLRAARAWLDARGLLGGPPGPAAAPDALAQLPAR